jgi:Tfp pilus assembly protein PilV
MEPSAVLTVLVVVVSMMGVAILLLRILSSKRTSHYRRAQD